MNLTPYLIRGLATGGQFALVAIGYTMVYGILKLINFAHGDLFMLSGIMMIYLAAAFPTMPMWVTILLMIALTVFVGFAIEKCAYSPLRTVAGGMLVGPLPPELRATDPELADKAPAKPVEAPRPGKPTVDRMLTIMLDPGHGGEDPGAIGPGGVTTQSSSTSCGPRGSSATTWWA